ncbi:MAG: redoxin domain-containing protein [Myxococcota bacterium]
MSESDDPGLVLGYPEGPYGVDNGSIIKNMVFSGFFSETASTGVANEYIETIDFQQIRALGTFRFMLLNVGAEWCAGCRVEAQLLPGRFDAWAEQGGYVMSVIIEDQSARPATRNNLERWLATYPINYTMVHDPRGNINSRFAPSGLPLNVILDLENMEILSQKVGEDLRFLDLFESLLE